MGKKIEHQQSKLILSDDVVFRHLIHILNSSELNDNEKVFATTNCILDHISVKRPKLINKIIKKGGFNYWESDIPISC